MLSLPKPEVDIQRGLWRSALELVPERRMLLPYELFVHGQRHIVDRMLGAFCVPCASARLAMTLGKQRSCKWKGPTFRTLEKSKEIISFTVQTEVCHGSTGSYPNLRTTSLYTCLRIRACILVDELVVRRRRLDSQYRTRCSRSYKLAKLAT